MSSSLSVVAATTGARAPSCAHDPSTLCARVYDLVGVDMPVDHDTDLERCRAVMQQVAAGMYAEPEWAAVLLAEPESLGAEQLTAQGVVMRLQVRTTTPDQLFAVEGIRTPLPLLTAAGVGAGAR